MPAYVYIVKCADGTLYTGWSTCLEKRLQMHNDGRASKYTRARLPVQMLYWEEHESKESAMKREWEIKKMSRPKKLDLCKEKRGRFMKRIFAPGCALLIYKPELAAKIRSFLTTDTGVSEEHRICCRNAPKLSDGTEIINTCAGCDRRYRELYDEVSTISLWEVLAKSQAFPFPDYKGQRMAILDACPTRDQVRIHKAVRELLKKMNIELHEPEKTREKSTCCGDSYYGVLPVDQVKEQMKKRAAEMPVDDVVVYCVSCCKSMHIGGKKPRYLADLLFAEETLPKTFEPDEWRAELEEFISEH